MGWEIPALRALRGPWGPPDPRVFKDCRELPEIRVQPALPALKEVPARKARRGPVLLLARGHQLGLDLLRQ